METVTQNNGSSKQAVDSIKKKVEEEPKAETRGGRVERPSTQD